MKKVLFIMKYPTCLSENLKKKFDGQMNACVRLGYEVWYLEWDGKFFYAVCKNTQIRKKVLTCRSFLGERRYYHSQYFIDLYRAGRRVMKKEPFDYIYMRNMPFFPPAVKMVKERSKNTKLIVEIPTYPFEGEAGAEKRILRKWAFRILERCRKNIFSMVDMFTICGELVDGFAYGKPAINIVNGIEVKDIPIREPRLAEKEIHMLLLASMSFWQAYDRVIEALKEYKGKEIIKLHFVGNDGDGSLEKWKDLTEQYGLEKSVFFHGALYGKQLDEIVNQSDIGIGTMGLYRRKQKEGATLKVREYMSRGLPFIYVGNEQAIKGKLEFVKQVPNNDSLLNMQEIAEFAKKFKNAGNIPECMRNYAKENMTWDSEFRKIFKKVEKGY